MSLFAGKLELKMKTTKTEYIAYTKEHKVIGLNDKPKEVKRVIPTTLPITLPVKSELTPQTPIYKFGINTREDLAKLMNGVILSYEGYSEIDLKEMGLDVEKINKLKEILLKK